MMSLQQAGEFFITLPSNASTHVFNNKTSSYTTKLCQPLHLTGDWAVGLSNVSIPWSFYNIQKGEEIIIFIKGKKKEVVYNAKLLAGYYDSITNIINTITNSFRQLREGEQNDLLSKLLDEVGITQTKVDDMEHYQNDPQIDPREKGDEGDMVFNFRYNARRNQFYLRYRRQRNKEYVIGMTPGLQNILGYTMDSHIQKLAIHHFPSAEEKDPLFKTVSGKFITNLEHTIPSEINVCLDLVKDHPMIGKLLRKISVHEYQYGKLKSLVFDRPHYVKVEKKYFDTLHVDLKDEHGQNLPFQFGTSSITLHFKRKPI